MDSSSSSEQRRKRKIVARPYYYYYSQAHYLSLRSFVLCLSFLVFLLFLSSDRFPLGPASFHPVLKASTLLSSATSSSILDSFNSNNNNRFLPILVNDRVLFPDHVLLIVSNQVLRAQDLDCVYYRKFNASDDEVVKARPALSAEQYGAFRSIVRCPVPEANYSGVVDLRRRVGDVAESDWSLRVRSNQSSQTVYSWEKVVYEAVLDGDTAVLCNSEIGHKTKHSFWVLHKSTQLQKWRKLCGFVKNPKRRFRFGFTSKLFK